jgi:hypothetical protein
MKKIYASFILLIAGLSLSHAQSLTQSNNAPAIGDTYRTTDVSTVGITPGTAGPAETWNMSAASIGTNITVYSVVAVPSSSAANYPSASLAIQTGTSSTYNFYTPSSTDLKYWGGSITVGTVNVLMTYTGTSAAVVTTYSMGYNATNSNPVSGTLSAFSQSGTFSGTCNVVADGFGTLALPSRTFTSVLRKKTNQDLSFTAGFISGSIKQESYEYFASALAKSPLFTIAASTVVTTFTTITQTVVTVNTDYQTVGINEIANNEVEFAVYPNPSKNYFNLSYTNENSAPVSYEIINATGQIIKKNDLGNDKGAVRQTISVADLQSGIYFVKVHIGNKTSVKKLTIQ